MYALINESLVVSILDPVADADRLGARYCAGGYIYQVDDRVLGALISGPGYPSEPVPPVFDGQGLPEAFMNPLGPEGLAPAGQHGQPLNDDPALKFGVGVMRPQSFQVIAAAVWQVEQTVESLRMTAQQAWQGWSATVEREVSLHGRTLTSATTFTNTGGRAIPLRWFPHPFYPPVPSGECCKFDIPVACGDNPGFWVRPDGWISRKLDHQWDRRGHFQAFEHAPVDKLLVLQRHPKLGIVTAQCNYPIAWLPIWGNCNTFSFEPYLDRPVAPGERYAWSMVYEF